MITDSIKASIREALDLLPSAMDSVPALAMIYAIGLQESRFAIRYQVLAAPRGQVRKGPARSFWQMEMGGGVIGVMTHHATEKHAERICELRGVEFDAHSIWSAMETDDVLGAAFARLLLWADPGPLPPLGATEEAWRCYMRNWRPGKPHRSTWSAYYSAAIMAADRRGAPRL